MYAMIQKLLHIAIIKIVLPSYINSSQKQWLRLLTKTYILFSRLSTLLHFRRDLSTLELSASANDLILQRVPLSSFFTVDVQRSGMRRCVAKSGSSSKKRLPSKPSIVESQFSLFLPFSFVSDSESKVSVLRRKDFLLDVEMLVEIDKQGENASISSVIIILTFEMVPLKY